MGTIQIPVHNRWRIAEGNEAPEEFPKVFFNVSDEDIASLKGPAGRVWGHCQLMRLDLSGPSIRRKCHEGVMSIVMEASSCHQNIFADQSHQCTCVFTCSYTLRASHPSVCKGELLPPIIRVAT
jgi:hypothetical protein